MGRVSRALSHEQLAGVRRCRGRGALLPCPRSREVRAAVLEGRQAPAAGETWRHHLGRPRPAACRGAAASGSVLQIAYMRRFDPLFLEAHRLVAAGAIGGRCLSWRPAATTISIRRGMPEDPADTGGFLLDMAAHDYDTACWMLGQRPVRVSVTRQALVHPQLLEIGDFDNALVTVELRRRAGSRARISLARARSVTTYERDHGRGRFGLCRQRRRGAGRDDPRCAQRRSLSKRLPGPLP